jgi:hypothetical protein
MGLVFGAIMLLWLMMVLLTALTADKESSPAEEELASDSSKLLHHPKQIPNFKLLCSPLRWRSRSRDKPPRTRWSSRPPRLSPRGSWGCAPGRCLKKEIDETANYGVRS